MVEGLWGFEPPPEGRRPVEEGELRRAPAGYTGMPAIAVAASREILNYQLHSLFLSCTRCTILYYLETREQHVVYTREPLGLDVEWSSDGIVVAAGADWPCVASYEVIGGHTPALILACSMQVGKNMVLTASPSRQLRKHEKSVVADYVRRFLGEGASIEKIAARMVLTGGSPASLIALIAESRGRRTPILVMAGRRLCVKHSGRWAAATTASLSGCNLLEDKLVVIKLQAGIPRIEVRELTDYR